MKARKKLNSTQVSRIRELYRNGSSIRHISKLFNICLSFTYRIIFNDAYIDNNYQIPKKQRGTINIKFCQELRNSGKTYAEIARLEAVETGRKKPLVSQSIFNALKKHECPL